MSAAVADISGMLDLVGHGQKHSRLFHFLKEHHDAIIAKQEACGDTMDWRALCPWFAENGLTNIQGEVPSVGCARLTWYRVRRAIAALRARHAQAVEQAEAEKLRRKAERAAAAKAAQVMVRAPLPSPVTHYRTAEEIRLARTETLSPSAIESSRRSTHPKYAPEILAACASPTYPTPAEPAAPRIDDVTSVSPDAVSDAPDRPDWLDPTIPGTFLRSDNLPEPGTVWKKSFGGNHVVCALGLFRMTPKELCRRWPAFLGSDNWHDVRKFASGVENGTLRVKEGDLCPATKAPWKKGADIPGYRSKLDFRTELEWEKYVRDEIMGRCKSQQEMTQRELTITLFWGR